MNSLESGNISCRSLKIDPVFTLATTKSISSLVWIPSPPYESVAVAFLYHSTIDIVDCNTNELIGQLLAKTMSRRGYSQLHILQSPTNLSWFYVIAGSPLGLLYMWKYPATNPELYTAQPIWEASGDPSSHPSDQIGIVGIFTPINSEKTTLVVTITRSGTLCLWDAMSHSLLSFSSSRTPTLLHCYSLWERNRKITAIISSVFPDPNEPLSVTMKIFSGKTSYRLGGQLHLNLSTGERFQYDCRTMTLTPIPSNSRIIRPSSTNSIIVQDTLEPWNIGSIVTSQSSLVAHGCDVKDGDFLPFQVF